MNNIINPNGHVCSVSLHSAALAIETSSFEVQVLLQVIVDKIGCLGMLDDQDNLTATAIGALADCALRSIGSVVSKNSEVLSASLRVIA